MNILLLSDTHGEQKRTQAICREHPAMDLYVHLGDIGFDPSLLEGFHIVQGNHDADAWCLRQEEILEISLDDSMEYLDVVNCILVKRLMFN